MIRYYSSPEGPRINLAGNEDELELIEVDGQTIELGMRTICRRLCLEDDCSPLTRITPEGKNVTISCVLYDRCAETIDEAARTVAETVNINALLF